jgi:hypothetical protein
MKKFLIVIIVFILGLIAFMPKDNLYFTLKNILKDERVEIVEDSLQNNILALDAQGISLFYDGIDSAKIDGFSLKPYLFYNSLNLENVSPSKDLKKMFNFSASTVDITYAIWDFSHVNIEAEGDFGALTGVIDITTQTIKLLLEPTLRFEKSQFVGEYFKKSDEGYVYESKIQ